LKYDNYDYCQEEIIVTSYIEVWIEIKDGHLYKYAASVTSYIEVWIEIAVELGASAY